MESVRLVIENCERELSDWLYLEYKHCIQLWDNILFTNIGEGFETLSAIAETKKERVTQLKLGRIIVLDPLADNVLRTDDFQGTDTIVIGGILGYEKPTGRTKKLISDKLSAECRNLGRRQLSIDIAVFTAKLVYLGMKVEEIEFTDELEIAFDETHSTIIPYGYPIIDGKVIVTPGLIEYLSGRH